MTNQSAYFNRLFNQVMNNSESKTWDTGVNEWIIVDVEEDDELIESCICGKENLRYLYTIKNDLNENVLYPIGSSCIKTFEREDLNDEIKIKEQLFKLLHAVEDNSFLTLSSEFFSRKLLLYFYDQGVFKATEFNDNNAHKDYQFMLDMFNKRTRTEKQNKKCIAIILNFIKPFLQEELKEKVRKN